MPKIMLFHPLKEGYKHETKAQRTIIKIRQLIQKKRELFPKLDKHVN